MFDYLKKRKNKIILSVVIFFLLCALLRSFDVETLLTEDLPTYALHIPWPLFQTSCGFVLERVNCQGFLWNNLLYDLSLFFFILVIVFLFFPEIKKLRVWIFWLSLSAIILIILTLAFMTLPVMEFCFQDGNCLKYSFYNWIVHKYELNLFHPNLF